MLKTLFTTPVPLRELSHCTLRRWLPAFGDPSVFGWAMVGVYAGAFALCVAMVRRDTGARVFWVFLAVLMGFLAVNKQLDFQSLATAAAHCIAKMQGWYGRRHLFRLGVMIVLALVGLAVAVAMLWSVRQRLRHHWPALAGLAAVLAFVVIRAAASRTFEAAIGAHLNHPLFNHALEFTGPALIALNALMLMRRHHAAPT